MTADAFTEAAREDAEKRYPRRYYQISRPAFVEGAEWARAHLASGGWEVTIRREVGKPATCEVRQGGVLVFSGRDHSADLHLAALEPTDAEHAARFAVASKHQIHGAQCVCGFESARSRSRTEHIMTHYFDELAALRAARDVRAEA